MIFYDFLSIGSIIGSANCTNTTNIWLNWMHIFLRWWNNSKQSNSIIMDTWNWMHVMKTVVWAISRFINLHVDWSFILIVVITLLTATLKAFLLANRTINFTSENDIFKTFDDLSVWSVLFLTILKADDDM